MSADSPVNSASSVSPHERAGLEPVAQGAGGLSALTAIMGRELSSLFFSPVAYVVGFVFLMLTGYSFFTETLQPGSEASFRLLFEQMAYVLVFALPILTMRSIAEEFSSGAIETLMTAPISDGSVILGKFLGTLVFYLLLIAATIPHLLLMIKYSTPVMSQVLVGYLGLVLLGTLFTAVGIFASSCTKHQLLAAILAITILVTITFVADYGAEYMQSLQAKYVCAYINALGHFENFNKGILDTGSLVYFVSATLFALFLATKVQESRRWR